MARDAIGETTAREADHVRRRLTIYLLTLFAIDVIAYLSDALTLLFGDPDSLPQLAIRYQAIRWGATVLMLGGLGIIRFAKPGYRVLAAVETVITFALVVVYVALGDKVLAAVAPEHGPTFSLLGITMLLSVRSALVPSRAIRTALVGVAAMGLWFAVSLDTFSAQNRTVGEGLAFMAVAIIIATSVTSKIIYGLRRQVRDAMRLGQYQLTRKLGEGGMGVVYEATHLMLRRPTAVKLLPADRAGADAVARFEREVKETSRLEHPNSVTIYDYGRTPEGVFYYAMEYVHGVTLAQLIRDGPIDSDRAAYLLGQAARALAEAHGLGLIHRDIKPANIMLCERAGTSDFVKVLDFGLVKTIDAPEVNEAITAADRIVGTPHYMAPEAITDPDAVDATADIYALGAVGYFLLTGREPFPGSSLVEICSQHLHVEPAAPSAVRGEPIDGQLEALILRCLAKSPADRPADGAALVEELDNLGLRGWTNRDAGRWWREHSDDGRNRNVGKPLALTINAGAR